MSKKTLAIFCNNYLGFSVLSGGTLIDELLKSFDIVFIAPSSAMPSILSATNNKCRVIPFEIKSTGYISAINTFICKIFSLTYAKHGKRQNRTGVIHKTGLRRRLATMPVAERYKTAIAIAVSTIAENSKFVRLLLQKIFLYTAPYEELQNILKILTPCAAIATTAGLDEDGVFFVAAAQQSIPTVALIQSWDRTACKGYPTICPHHCIVWNRPMQYEAENFLDLPKDGIHVEGAPTWDRFFRSAAHMQDFNTAEFLASIGLSSSLPVVFYAVNSPSTHNENIRLLSYLADEVSSDRLQDVQFVFRLHPAYLHKRQSLEEIKEHFSLLADKRFHLNIPEVIDATQTNYVLSEVDKQFVTSMFIACDITIGIMSSWMIESAIFGKPNICIEFGKYENSVGLFDLSEYKVEHIARIFSYGAIHCVRSIEELSPTIQSVLSNPRAKERERLRLIDVEGGPNRGEASFAVARRIEALVDA